jgi:protein O-GlcNAc transferase
MTAQPQAAKSAAPPMDASDVLRAALARHQAGDLEAAARLYGQVLEAFPDNPDALHLLGVLTHQQGDNPTAAEMIGRAIALHGANAGYHANFGVVLQKQGRTDEAIEAYRRAIELDPVHADAHGNLANLLKDRSKSEEAISHYEAAIRYQPRVRTTHKHLASLYIDVGRHEEAAELFQAFLAISPDDAEANSNYGYALEHLERYEDAERHYRRAHELAPESAEICANLGNALKALGRLEEAKTYLTKATTLAPGDVRVLRNLIAAEVQQKNYVDAVPLLERLIAAEPEVADFHGELGTCLARLGRPIEAMPHFARAGDLEPKVATHWANLAAALMQQNRFIDAVPLYRRAVELDPDSVILQVNLCTALELSGKLDEANLHSHFAVLMKNWHDRMNPSVANVFRSTCDFDALAEMGDLIETCDRHVEPENLIGVFLALRPLTEDLETDRRVTALHRKWGGELMRRAKKHPLAGQAVGAAKGPIRIGLLSSDLRSHAVAKFMKPIFERYDRSRFELHCYMPFDLPGDPNQVELRKKSTSFNITDRMSMREVAERIRFDKIDVLFDLNGATRNSQVEAMAWRPAPVQVTYLGYGGTTGIETMDYALMDRFVAPTEPDLWTETPLLLKGALACFTDYPDEPIAPEPPMTRNGVVTFGTMNAPYKYTPSTIAAWTRILHAVPGSRMLFVRPEITSVMLQTNIAKEFGKHGIGPERLFFAANQAGQFHHLPFYNEIDIALDTYPAVGGTTSCDTLWMGVPVVGRYGPNTHQRINHAWVNHCGFPELSVATNDEYVATAVALANDPKRLTELRQILRPALKASPLYDAAGFINDFQERVLELVATHGLR